MTVWRPPAPSWRAPGKRLIDLTLDGPTPVPEPEPEPEPEAEAPPAVTRQRLYVEWEVEDRVRRATEGGRRALAEEVARRRKVEAETPGRIEVIRRQQAEHAWRRPRPRRTRR